MKVLVTGGAGFIGSHVVDLLIEHGHEVVVVDNLSTGRVENLNPKARFYHLDVSDPNLERVFAREKPDCVNHHAAQASVPFSLAEPVKDAQINILGSINLLALSQRFSVSKFIYVSSGGACYGEPQYLPVDEAHPVNPLSPYGASKHAFEHYLYLFGVNYGLDYTVLRYANAYGPRQDPYGEAGVVAVFASKMIKGESPVINGDGLQERDFVYVGDYARASLVALNRGTGQVFNLGSGVGVSVNQAFEKLKEITGYVGPEIHGPAKLGEIFKIYLDASKARRELGWQPAVSLETGLTETVKYFRESVAS